MTATLWTLNRQQMDRRSVLYTSMMISLFTAGLIGIYWMSNLWLQWALLMGWTWLVILAALLSKEWLTLPVFHLSLMYVLIGSTFLNQALLSISVGFFTIFIYRVFLIGCFVLFLIRAVHSGGFSKEWQRMPIKGSIYFLMIWLAYGAVSLIWSWSVVEGLNYWFLFGIGILFLLMAVFTFTQVDHLLMVHKIWLLMSTLLLLLGLINHFGQIQLPTSTLYGGPTYKQAYPTAVFTNQNDFATLLAISCFFYLAACRYAKKRWQYAMHLALAGCSVWLIYLTESRASLLGIAAGIVFYFFLLLPKVYKKGALIGGACIGACGLLFLSAKLLAKLQGLFPGKMVYSVNDTPSSNAVRVHLLQSGWQYLTDSFGVGVGAGNLPVYLKYRPLLNTNHIFEIHNWLAEITGNFGLLFGAGYLAMYCALFISLYKSYGRALDEKTKLLLETCMTAQIALLVSSISPSSVSNLYFHWVFLGFVLCTVSVLGGTRQEIVQSGVARAK
ncbi:O-antigen ligase family protein [Sporolactobacillus kofuensis]|uniref:O-antigen ligase family protein n=1 Tax=Sporolactobacillus kofuensis TaxID=269672 RepID=A0ABW1WC50_9BACL|nr:O-antigen ligase family protein [Sporolactobacillus kofuensis]MCO7174938.1 O-antigen ligase family protein [Sporolactobacillus kofuensis]